MIDNLHIFGNSIKYVPTFTEPVRSAVSASKEVRNWTEKTVETPVLRTEFKNEAVCNTCYIHEAKLLLYI